MQYLFVHVVMHAGQPIQYSVECARGGVQMHFFRTEFQILFFARAGLSIASEPWHVIDDKEMCTAAACHLRLA